MNNQFLTKMMASKREEEEEEEEKNRMQSSEGGEGEKESDRKVNGNIDNELRVESEWRNEGNKSAERNSKNRHNMSGMQRQEAMGEEQGEGEGEGEGEGGLTSSSDGIDCCSDLNFENIYGKSVATFTNSKYALEAMSGSRRTKQNNIAVPSHGNDGDNGDFERHCKIGESGFDNNRQNFVDNIDGNENKRNSNAKKDVLTLQINSVTTQSCNSTENENISTGKISIGGNSKCYGSCHSKEEKAKTPFSPAASNGSCLTACIDEIDNFYYEENPSEKRKEMKSLSENMCREDIENHVECDELTSKVLFGRFSVQSPPNLNLNLTSNNLNLASNECEEEGGKIKEIKENLKRKQCELDNVTDNDKVKDKEKEREKEKAISVERENEEEMNRKLLEEKKMNFRDKKNEKLKMNSSERSTASDSELLKSLDSEEEDLTENDEKGCIFGSSVTQCFKA